MSRAEAAIRTVSIGSADLDRSDDGAPIDPSELTESSAHRSILLLDGRRSGEPGSDRKDRSRSWPRLRPVDLVLESSADGAAHGLERRTGRVVADEHRPAAEVAQVVATLLRGRVPAWLPLPAAADVLERVSSALRDQPWPETGALVWSGWGGPSADLVASNSGRWVPSPPDPPSTVTTGAIRIDAPIWGFTVEGAWRDPTGAEPSAGNHHLVDRLPARRTDRLDRLAGLWSGVAAGGLVALTYPVDAAPNALAAHPGEPAEVLVDHQRMIEELLAATSGRILTADVVVHHRPDGDLGFTWTTLVLRRLADGHRT